MPKDSEVLELKLDGEVFDPDKPTARIIHIKAFLDGSPHNEIFTSETLCKIARCSTKGTLDFTKREAFAGYHYRRGNTNLFGNPKAIALLKKKLERA